MKLDPKGKKERCWITLELRKNGKKIEAQFAPTNLQPIPKPSSPPSFSLVRACILYTRGPEHGFPHSPFFLFSISRPRARLSPTAQVTLSLFQSTFTLKKKACLSRDPSSSSSPSLLPLHSQPKKEPISLLCCNCYSFSHFTINSITVTVIKPLVTGELVEVITGGWGKYNSSSKKQESK